MKFKGTIIITDPCYIIPKPNVERPLEKNYSSINEFIDAMEEYYRLRRVEDMWDNGSINIFTGEGMNKFGFTNYIWRDTIYGDWSCKTFKLKNSSVSKKPNELVEDDIYGEYGCFCADAGLVGVFLLDEVLKLNPKFNYHIEKKWTTTLIEDFEGEIEDIVINDEVYIKGTGNHNFITTQTGF